MITSDQIRRVAIEALTTERTAKRAYRQPGRVRECTRLRLTRAARALSLPAPPTLAEVNGSPLTALSAKTELESEGALRESPAEVANGSRKARNA